ncbi:hypothetical protein K3552_14390 [Leisingera aquaemixtae]|uniref:hypothetical protein n=1 Tax=Leisingera aquaemixtae TaxID=1396826 RepID=UPI0021A3DCAE|nr:hypothetical protein [Leisingera aquaemixtae]UWQ36656.1 hypothetical protein K3552_14390 [Leisingera aquaemixtae]
MRLRDPRYCQVALDNNALRRNGATNSGLVDRFHDIEEQLGLSIIKPCGVEAELQHPNTPHAAKVDMGGIFSIATQLTDEETKARDRLRALLRGNAMSGKHQADADHLFEAEKYGGGYFITHDNRLHRTKREISDILPRPAYCYPRRVC